MSSIGLLAFGTFGHPYGFTQTAFLGDNDVVSNRTFDLDTNAIQLYRDSKIFSIRKENSHILSYSAYSYAREKSSERPGTFIGSAIIFKERIPDENITIRCLNEFNDDLIQKNITNEVFNVTHSKDFQVSKPRDFDKLYLNLRVIEENIFAQSSNKSLVVYCETNPEKLKYYFNQSLNILLKYNTIYFTSSEEVATFVYKQKVFTLVQKEGFEQLLVDIQEEKRQDRLNAIAELERHKEKLLTDRSNVIGEFQKHIELNEKSHSENERILNKTKTDLKEVNQLYSEFSEKIDVFVKQLKEGKEIKRVKHLFNQKKDVFTDSVNQHKRLTSVGKISEVYIPSTLKPNETTSQDSVGGNEPLYVNQSLFSKKQDMYKIATAALLILWVLTLMGFFLFCSKTEDSILPDPKTNTENPVAKYKYRYSE